jgi:hypothetical protein
VAVDLRDQRIFNNDEEAGAIARKILTMANGTEIDFYSEGKKFTAPGQGLIEAANQMRTRFRLLPLKIEF